METQIENKKELLIAEDRLLDLLEKTNDKAYLESLTDQELKYLYEEADMLYMLFNNIQMGTKRLCNSVYGGLGTSSLRYYNMAVADDITAEGREACKLTDKMANAYFHNKWHNDTEWHQELMEKFPTFFPNGLSINKIPDNKDLCVYSDTDSCIGSTLIHTEDGTKTIEDIFNSGEYLRTGKDGTEYRMPKNNIMNFTIDNGEVLESPFHVSRHKVTKGKWKVKSKCGKEVTITEDHCIIVFRNNKKINIKPSEVIKGDKILVRKNIPDGYELVDFEVEQLEDFNDEYVYDFSMKSNGPEKEDKNTFIANDILIHNSNYVAFDYIFESMGLDPYVLQTKETTEFIVYFMQKKMDPMYDNLLNSYINGRNGKNTMIFELEAVGGFGIWAAKKKYVFSKLWEDGKYIADKGKLKVVGLEIRQKAASKRVKKILETYVNTIFARRGKIDAMTFFSMCKSVKTSLHDATIEELSKATKLNNYHKYVVSESDTNIEFAPKTPVTVRGAARYNQLIRLNKLEGEYPILKDDMFVKIYYDVNGDIFTYPADYGVPPIAPELSIDIQLEKLVFNPVKKLVDGLIDGDLNTMGQDKVQTGFSALMNKFKKK